MKLLFYNLGYARGITGSTESYIKRGATVLYQSKFSQQQILNKVADLLEKESPDVFLCAEIALGSFGNQYFNQHEYLKTKCLAVKKDSATSKYGVSALGRFPFHKGNANGVISFVDADIHHYYMPKSRKKLVLITKIDGLTIFSVHLPLVRVDRSRQLQELSRLVNECDGDVVVCGDFNIFAGLNELSALLEKTNLQLSGESHFTFPSNSTKKQLDIFLYRFSDKQKIPQMRTIHSLTSDHLPIVLEW